MQDLYDATRASAMSSLRKKTVFTPEQRASLEAAYSDGLVSTGAANSAAIGTLAEELQLDVSVIKVRRWGHTRGCMYILFNA